MVSWLRTVLRQRDRSLTITEVSALRDRGRPTRAAPALLGGTGFLKVSGRLVGNMSLAPRAYGDSMILSNEIRFMHSEGCFL
jgi:hypothetical protein